jgi:hypothetical protein
MASRSRNNRIKLGIAEIEGINILGRNSHVLTSRAKITNLNIGELYNLLYELWKSNGRLVVVAIGVARVKALNSLPVIVNIVCKEDINLRFSLTNVAQLSNKFAKSRNCNSTYDIFHA